MRITKVYNLVVSLNKVLLLLLIPVFSYVSLVFEKAVILLYVERKPKKKDKERVSLVHYFFTALLNFHLAYLKMFSLIFILFSADFCESFRRNQV